MNFKRKVDRNMASFPQIGQNVKGVLKSVYVLGTGEGQSSPASALLSSGFHLQPGQSVPFSPESLVQLVVWVRSLDLDFVNPTNLEEM